MQTDELISVREYLSTSYDPDCDYVDGVIVKRNVGEFDHARLQMAIGNYLYHRRKELGIVVGPEQRVQISATRFRVPDICVRLASDPPEQIFTTPPFICVEVLSPEDRISTMQERITDYLEMGVRYVWILDPRKRKAYRATETGVQEISELRTENPDILIPIDALFEE